MASITFPLTARKAKLSDGTQHGYVYVPAKAGKQTILLLHGFPSSSYDWRHQISHLPTLGYGVLVPDLLGYGDTDKPVDVEAYTMDNIGRHIDEILALENLDKVVGVCHYFGSTLLTHLVIYRKSRLAAAIFVSVGFLDPSTRLDLDAITAQVLESQGDMTFGYISYFMTDGAPAAIEAANQSFDSLLYAQDPMDLMRHLGAQGGLEATLNEGKTFHVGDFVSSEELRTHNKILSFGGYAAPLNWYKLLILLGPSKSDKALSDEDKEFSLPTLLVIGERDFIIHWETHAMSTARWAKNMELVRVDSGHWPMLERRDNFDEILEGWIKKL